MIRIFLRLFYQGIHDLTVNPLVQFLTLTAVTLVVFISGLFFMALVTVNYQLGTTRGETAFQVYWDQGASLGEVQDQWRNFRNLPGYTEMRTFTPEQALNELKRKLDKSGGSNINAIIKDNPLPATALVFFAPENLAPDVENWIVDTEKYFQHLAGVERVVTTPLRDELGQAWRKMSHFIMWPSMLFLGLVLSLVVGNTIRLGLVGRAHEVEILQMIGAYNWYIRFPMIITGGLLGFLGGILGLSLLGLIFFQIRDALNFPPLLMEVQFLPFSMALALIVIPCLMGMIASWLAVRD